MNSRLPWTRLTPAEMSLVATYASRHGIRVAAEHNEMSTTAVKRACTLLGIAPKPQIKLGIKGNKQSKAQRVNRAKSLINHVLADLALTMGDVFPNKNKS